MTLAQIQALAADPVKDRVILATDTNITYFVAKGKLGSTAEVHTTPGKKATAATAAELAAATAAQKSDVLRSLRINGAGSLATVPRKLWRLVSTLHRQIDAPTGYSWPNRVRAITLGDSVACDIGGELAGVFGTGGGDMLLYSWTRQAAPTPSDVSAANYATWSAGVFILSDEFARTMNGSVTHLDAGVTNGTWVQRTNIVSPVSSVHVGYLSADGYGSFKLQYKVNGTGSWIDAIPTLESGGGSVVSNAVNTDNDGAEVYRTAAFTLPGPDTYHFQLIATSGRVRLCSAVANCGAMLAGPAAGRNSYSGALTVNMSAAGRQLEQHFSLTTQAVVTATLGHFNPQIIVYKSANGWSLSSYQAYWPAYAAKLQAAAPNALLVVCGSHPRGAAPESDNAGDIAVDDYLKEWCASQNGAIFVDVRQSFPAYQTRYNPGVVFTLNSPVISSVGHGLTNGTQASLSTSIGGSLPTGFTVAGTYFVKSVTADTFELSATLDGTSITPTGSQSGSHTLNTLLADDLWNDGIHIYDMGNHAGGELWIRAMVLAELKPAFDYILSKRKSGCFGTVTPVPAHEFRMFDGITAAGFPAGVQQRLVYTMHPRFPGYQVMRPISASYNSGTGAFAEECGWGSTGGDSLNPNALVLLNRGQEAIVCGNHIAGVPQGMTFNIALATTTNLERTRDGYRFKLFTGIYGKKAGFIIEATSANFAETRVWGINRNATDASEGTALCAWINGGNQTRTSGVTSAGSPNISFANIFFPPPVGALITGTGIPANTRILSSTNTTAVLSKSIADGGNTGLTFTITQDSTFDYYGQTLDANLTSFSYQEPTAVTNIFTPVCSTAGTGDRVRAIAVVGSYLTKAEGEAAVEVGEVFYDEGTGKTRTRLA